MVNGRAVVGSTQTLLSGIYLIASLVNLPYLIAAPTYKNQMANNEMPEKWINPLGFDDTVVLNNESILTGQVLLTRILDQTHIALNEANETKEEFANRVFSVDSEQLHETWEKADYDWLPQYKDLHKKLDKPVEEEHLSSLGFDDALVNNYHYLQMIAVGLEQLVKDQGEHGQFLDRFSRSEYNLLLVLQEIQAAIIERGVNYKMQPDVRRYNMPESLRVENNATTRNVRDWIIYRDYINLLQYIWEVFRYLKSKVYSSLLLDISENDTSENKEAEAPANKASEGD